MPTNAQIGRHLKRGISLKELIIETLESARAHILSRAGDPIEDDDLNMSIQCSSTLDLIQKYWDARS